MAWLIPLYLALMSGLMILAPLVIWFFWGLYQFRNRTFRAKRAAIFFIIAMAMTGIIGWSYFHSTRRPDRFLIPQNYVGWVLIEYQVKGAPPLTLEEGHDLYRISAQGRLQTSSKMEDGMATDQYFYVTPTSRREINSTGWGEGGLIWGGSFGDGKIGVGDSKGQRTVQTPPSQTFFAGTEAQFQKAGPEPNSQQMQKLIDGT